MKSRCHGQPAPAQCTSQSEAQYQDTTIHLSNDSRDFFYIFKRYFFSMYASFFVVPTSTSSHHRRLSILGSHYSTSVFSKTFFGNFDTRTGSQSSLKFRLSHLRLSQSRSYSPLRKSCIVLAVCTITYKQTPHDRQNTTSRQSFSIIWY